MTTESELHRAAARGIYFLAERPAPAGIAQETRNENEVRQFIDAADLDHAWAGYFCVPAEAWRAYAAVCHGQACTGVRKDGKPCQSSVEQIDIPRDPRHFVPGAHDRCRAHRAK
jgi:hypothetical protein